MRQADSERLVLAVGRLSLRLAVPTRNLDLALSAIRRILLDDTALMLVAPFRRGPNDPVDVATDVVFGRRPGRSHSAKVNSTRASFVSAPSGNTGTPARASASLNWPIASNISDVSGTPCSPSSLALTKIIIGHLAPGDPRPANPVAARSNTRIITAASRTGPLFTVCFAV
jgi:hypothetical protein